MKRTSFLPAALLVASMLAPITASAATRGGWAVISSAGTLISGKGVKSSSSFGTGSYKVKFNKGIKKCAVLVTAGDSSPNATGLASMTFWTRPHAKNHRVLEVYSYDNDTKTHSDTGFSILVQC